MKIQMCCIVVGALSLSSCAVDSLNYAGAPAPVYAKGEMSKTARKQIKSASLTIESESVLDAVTQAKNIVKKQGGYVESSSQSDAERSSLSLRVPSKLLESTVDALADLGDVTYRRVKVKDVTDSYTDIEARLKNLRVLRERLRALYKKASSVKETLEVEKELARVQTELDSAESRIKNMRQSIQQSELSLTVHKKRVPGPLRLLGRGIGWIGKKLWVLN